MSPAGAQRQVGLSVSCYVTLTLTRRFERLELTKGLVHIVNTVCITNCTYYKQPYILYNDT